MTIRRAYTVHYRDNDQLAAHVDWADGSHTMGAAELYHGVRIPVGTHMGALFDRALRDGLTIEHETW